MKLEAKLNQLRNLPLVRVECEVLRFAFNLSYWRTALISVDLNCKSNLTAFLDSWQSLF